MTILKWVRGWGDESYRVEMLLFHNKHIEKDAIPTRLKIMNLFGSDIACSIYLALILLLFTSPNPYLPMFVAAPLCGLAFLASEWFYAKRRMFQLYQKDGGSLAYGTRAGASYMLMLLPFAHLDISYVIALMLPLCYGLVYKAMVLLPDTKINPHHPTTWRDYLGENIGRAIYGAVLGLGLGLALW